jgi:asparagine synthase (glutamine-hydrolysing)
MAGIYGVLLDKKSSKSNLYEDFYNYNFPNTIQEEIGYGEFLFGRSVLDKFKKDRFLYEDNYYIICFEGINYSNIQSPSEFIKAYQERGTAFVKDLKGVFSGFLLSKEENQLYVFTDNLSTKKIFYYHSEDGLAFSSEMHVLSKYLRENDIVLSYDLDGIYSLALYGQMINDHTVVKEIKKMGYGSILNYNLVTRKLKIEQYYKPQKKIVAQKLSDVIETLDRLMEDAVKAEWQKDINNCYHAHLALISGGMDSRVNTLLAKKIGFENINGYTYGDPNSSDVKIAGKIASDNFYSHLQCNLNTGNFFMENILEQYVKPTDGLTEFTSSAIIYNAFSMINCSRYGLLHSGQIGDYVFGSLLKPNYDFKDNLDKIGLTGFVQNKKLLEKINSLKQVIGEYQGTDYEIFAYGHRLTNGALFGDSVFCNFIDQASPFYNKDLLDYVFTLPNKYKLNQKIYFEWLKKKHPETLKYKWEKIGLKPNSNFNLKYGKLFKKYINGGKKYFGLRYDSMNPIGVWFSEDPKPLMAFDAIFNEQFEQVKNADLKKDLEQIYRNDIFAYRNKFAVITVLLSLKLHFG